MHRGRVAIVPGYCLNAFSFESSISTSAGFRDTLENIVGQINHVHSVRENLLKMSCGRPIAETANFERACLVTALEQGASSQAVSAEE